MSRLLHLLILKKLCRKKRLQRRWAIRPIHQNRTREGFFTRYVHPMRVLDSEMHFKYFRMSRDRFDELHRLVAPRIQHKGTHSMPISTQERLAVTLRLLASGDMLSSVATSYRIGVTTAANIFAETCRALWDVLSPVYVKAPKTESDWLDVSREFGEKWNFPHCLGAIDGKHVAVQAPPGSGSLFYNYKGSFSIVLLAVVDANYLFRIINVGHYGRWSDGGIFAQTSFGRHLLSGTLNLPQPQLLPGSESVAPFVFVGDEAFPAKENLLRPYPGRNLTVLQRLFNYRLSRARRIVENGFGILSARWRIYHRRITASPANVDAIVKATVALHNYLRLSDPQTYTPPSFVDTDDTTGSWRCDSGDGPDTLQDIPRLGTNRVFAAASQVRDVFAAHFQNEGAVSWQNDMINNGRI